MPPFRGPARISFRTPKKKEKIARNHNILNGIMMTFVLYLSFLLATYKDCVINSFSGEIKMAKEQSEIKKRYLFRCPDALYGVLADRGPKMSPFLDEQGKKISPFLARLIDSKVPWDPRDGFHLGKNPFADDEGTTQIVIRLEPVIHKAFRIFAAEAATNMTRVLIQWLIEEPEISAALRKQKRI
jgi:hypothetical protein